MKNLELIELDISKMNCISNENISLVLEGHREYLTKSFYWGGSPQKSAYWSRIRVLSQELTEKDKKFLRVLQATSNFSGKLYISPEVSILIGVGDGSVLEK
jgi:hypothetical protein